MVTDGGYYKLIARSQGRADWYKEDLDAPYNGRHLIRLGIERTYTRRTGRSSEDKINSKVVEKFGI